MTTFGIVTDYTAGTPIRPATAAEWRKTADAVSIDRVYQGIWQDEDGRSVYVDGGPDAEVTDNDIRALGDEAAAHGDYAQANLCEQALEFADTDKLVYTDDDAHDKCVRVILDYRANVAAS
jgi:hypothetical protein